jgi:transposase
MTQDDVLFGYRVRLFALAGEQGVTAACRLMGVHRSTYYRWKREVERSGLEMLRPRERRRPQMPNQLAAVVEQQIVAFALGHPGLGPKRIAAQLARPEWGGLVVSANGVYKCLARHGLSTRAKRLALVAGYRAQVGPPTEPEPEPHIDVERPGELVGMDCFSWAACMAPRALSGRSPRPIAIRASPGRTWWWSRASLRACARARHSRGAWPKSCAPRVGGWSGS